MLFCLIMCDWQHSAYLIHVVTLFDLYCQFLFGIVFMQSFNYCTFFKTTAPENSFLVTIYALKYESFTQYFHNQILHTDFLFKSCSLITFRDYLWGKYNINKKVNLGPPVFFPE